MPRTNVFLTIATLCLVFLAGNAVSQNTSPSTPTVSKPVTRPAQHQNAEDDGQRVFDQNCSRCHTTPDGFSPRISGTVARHMRIRASLSRADEQALIRFLNP